MSIWGLVRAWVFGDAAVTSWLVFTPGFMMQIYIGLIAGGIATLLFLTWGPIFEWRNALRERSPEGKFRNMYCKITETRDLVAEDLRLPGVVKRAEQFHAINELTVALNELGIKCPAAKLGRATYSVNWIYFLSHIAALSRVGDLRQAREYGHSFKGVRKY